MVYTSSESFLHGYRDPELHRPADEGSIKAFRRDANNGVRHAIEHLRSADDRRIAMEALFPHLIADDNHGMSITAGIFGGFEPSPQDGADAERVEIVGRNNAPSGTIGAVADG